MLVTRHVSYATFYYNHLCYRKLFRRFRAAETAENNPASSHKPTQAASQTAGWKSDSLPERLNPNKLLFWLSLMSQESRKRFLVPREISPRVTFTVVSRSAERLLAAAAAAARRRRRPHRFMKLKTLAGIRGTQKPLKCSCRVAPLRGTTTPRGLIFHPKMFLMSCGALNVKVYIYVARSLLDYHGNWGSMLEVSGRQRDLDEPCECGGRDGERERERQRKWKQMERKVRNKSSEIFVF